jgi:hypothetical protein
MKITLKLKTDQFNTDDFVAGSKTFKIADATQGSDEQQWNIHLEGEKRVWRPPPTVMKILMAAWGDESDDWIGRQVTLYRDETVTFGREATGGIRVSHMSNLPGDKTFTIKLISTRGKKEVHRVEPLKDDAPPTGEITKPQLQKLAALITQAGFENDENGRADWLAFASGVIERPIQASKELSASEAALVIAELEKTK